MSEMKIYRVIRDIHCQRSDIILARAGEEVVGYIANDMFYPESDEWAMSVDIMLEYLKETQCPELDEEI